MGVPQAVEVQFGAQAGGHEAAQQVGNRAIIGENERTLPKCLCEIRPLLLQICSNRFI